MAHFVRFGSYFVNLDAVRLVDVRQPDRVTVTFIDGTVMEVVHHIADVAEIECWLTLQ